jgi:DEAD/DEAH box helicase domain-containing protein
MAMEIAGLLSDAGDLSAVGGKHYFAGGQNPAIGVSLRHMSDNTFSIVERTNHRLSGDPPPVGRAGAKHFDDKQFEKAHRVIANVDAISAPELVYPEAVYLHNGESYLVRELDLNAKIAYVERRETDYYTQAVLESNVLITRERQTSPAVDDVLLAYGHVDVSWQTVAFKKIKFNTRENIGLGPVDIPAQTLSTTAMWLAPCDALRARMKAAGYRASEGVCGLRNLAVVALPMVAMCDSRDLGGFHLIHELLRICHEMVAECPCEEGCPSCVGLPNLRPAIHSDPDLSRGYPMPNKAATIRLLELLRGVSLGAKRGEALLADSA